MSNSANFNKQDSAYQFTKLLLLPFCLLTYKNDNNQIFVFEQTALLSCLPRH